MRKQDKKSATKIEQRERYQLRSCPADPFRPLAIIDREDGDRLICFLAGNGLRATLGEGVIMTEALNETADDATRSG